MLFYVGFVACVEFVRLLLWLLCFGRNAFFWGVALCCLVFGVIVTCGVRAFGLCFICMMVCNSATYCMYGLDIITL